MGVVEILAKGVCVVEWFLEMCGVVRGLIKELNVALAKEVRMAVLADWITRSSRSISSGRKRVE